MLAAGIAAHVSWPFAGEGRQLLQQYPRAMAALQLPFAIWSASDEGACAPAPPALDGAFLLTQEHCLFSHHSTLTDETWLFVGFPSGVIYKWAFTDARAAASASARCQQPELVMIGHKSSINAMAISRYRTDCTGFESASDSDHEDEGEGEGHAFRYVEVLVSVDGSGELAVWNCHDGRCLLHNLRAMPLATATPAASVGPHTIAVSPNCEYCVLAGWEGKLVVVRLASLEVVQVVEDEPWTYAAGFLVVPVADEIGGDSGDCVDAGDCMDCVDGVDGANGADGAVSTGPKHHTQGTYTHTQHMPHPPHTTHHQALAQERRQMLAQRRIRSVDFVSAHASASPIMARAFDQHTGQFVGTGAKAVLPAALRQQHADALRCRLLRPSPAHPGLAAVVADDNRAWIIDFPGERYAAFALDFAVAGVEFVHGDVLMLWGVGGVRALAFYRATLVGAGGAGPPVLGPVVHKLDLVLTDEQGELMEPGAAHGPCAIRLLGRGRIVHVQQGAGAPVYAEYQVTYDPASPSAAVRLQRVGAPRALALLATPLPGAAAITCAIAAGGDAIAAGTAQGRVLLGTVEGFFRSRHVPGPAHSAASPAGAHAVVALHHAEGVLVSANAMGAVVFWHVAPEGGGAPVPCGWTRAHHQHRVTGFHVQRGADGVAVCTWSDAGHVALHEWFAEDGAFRTVHVLRAATRGLLPTSLFWRQGDAHVGAALLVEFDGGRERVACDLGARRPLALDAAGAATLMSGATTRVTIADARTWQRGLEQTLLHGGAVLLGAGKDALWPARDLPVQLLLTVDVRAVVARVGADVALARLARAVLAQLVDWGSVGVDDVGGEGVEGQGEGGKGNGHDKDESHGSHKSPDSTDSHKHQNTHRHPYEELFESRGPSEAVAFGLAGANGNVSAWTRRRSSDFAGISPMTTATLQLCVSVLLGALDWGAAGGAHVAAHVAALQRLYAYGDGRAVRPAALSFLAKFWQDAQSAAIQSSARQLFAATLTRLAPGQRAGVVRYWQDYLPGGGAPGAGARAVVILAVVACQEGGALGGALRRAVAEGLVGLLLDDSRRNAFRMAAVELIGRGYAQIWRPYVHGGSMVRLLWGWLGQLGAAGAPAAPAYGITMAALTALLTDDAHRAEHLAVWAAEWRAAAPPQLVLGLHVLRRLLETRPTALAGLEPALAEALLAAGRAAPEHPAHVAALDELAGLFGSVALSPDRRRLAVGAAHGLIYVYACHVGAPGHGTCLFTLAGHAHPVTTVSFAPGAPGLLLSYSAREACCRWWVLGDALPAHAAHEPRASLAHALLGALLPARDAAAPEAPAPSPALVQGQLVRPLKTVVVLPELTAAVDCIPTVSVAWLDPLRVQWRPEARAVELIVGHDLIMTIAMPV